METAAENLSSTPFDDAFRTLMGNCPRLVLFMLNEVFGEHFTGEEELVDRDGNFFPIRETSSNSKLVVDSYFQIAGRPEVSYHIECQSTHDDTMAVRMARYDMEIALDNPELGNGVIKIRLPKSAVIFLRKSKRIPDKWQVSIIPPQNCGAEALTYSIPAVKLPDYSAEELLEKRLYFLYPFHLFSYEKEIKRATSENDIRNAVAHADKMIHRLIDTGDVSNIEVSFIYEAMNKIMLQFSRNNSRLRKGVEEYMGGRILPTLTAKAVDEGHSLGIAEERRKREADIEELYRRHVDDSVILSVYGDSDFDLPAIKARALAQ